MEQETVKEVRKFGAGRCQTCGKPLTSGEIGDTCLKHSGHLRSTALVAEIVPEGYLRMSKVCRALEAKGFKTHAIVKACGGDACTEPVMEPVTIFQPTYVGGGKWLNPEILVKGAELLKAAGSAPKEPKIVKVAKGNGVSATANALKAHAVVK